jgi:hypothetical protein
MTLRRLTLAALAAAAFGYAGVTQRPATGDESVPVLQWTMRAGEFLRLGRALVETVENYIGHARGAAATVSTLIALAERAECANVSPVSPVSSESLALVRVAKVPCVPMARSLSARAVMLCSVDRHEVLWEGEPSLVHPPMPWSDVWRTASRRFVRVTM